MVAQQLERRGIRDRRVLEAMATIPREIFVLTDANAFFARDAVSKLVDRLGDHADVSCVFGNVQIRPEG